MPPQIARKVENTIKSLEVLTYKKKSHAPKGRPQKAKRFPRVELAVGGAVVVLLLGIYAVKSLPRADIIISPALEAVSLQEKITADAAAKNINVAQKIIPARLIEEIKESSQEFLATGSASNDGKASGTIKIYNKVSPGAAITLKEGTHFLSDGGKYFVILKRVVVPAMKGKTPGVIETAVQAEEAGESYNIGASKFSVPKLAGNALYYSIWGESTAAMSGGYAGKVKKVTADDIETAKSTLTKKLLAEAEAALRSNIGEDEILLQGALENRVTESKADVKANTIAEKFNALATVKASALVLKKEDVQKFAQGDLLAKLPSGKALWEESVAIDYAPDTIDVAAGKGKINLQISGKAYYEIDINDILRSVAKKSSAEIKDMVEKKYGSKVSNVQVDFWPFWVKKAPKNEERIEVNLQFE